MSEEKLKHCPFCGEKAYQKLEVGGFGWPDIYRIGCQTLNCRGNMNMALGQHEKELAANLWNTRATNREQETK